MKVFLSVLLLTGMLGLSGAGKFDYKFAEGTEPKDGGWELKNLGDQKAVVTRAAMAGNITVNPLLLVNPNAQSWLNLVRNFSIKDLSGVKKIRATAWIRSNRADKAVLIISEGAKWGEAIDVSQRCRSTKAGEWEMLQTELTRGKEEKLISIALGLDYYSEKTYVAVDRILIEFSAGGDFAPLAEYRPAYGIIPPPQIVEMCSDEVRKQYSTGVGHPLDPVPVKAVAGDIDKIELHSARGGSDSAILYLGNISSNDLTFQIKSSAENVSLYRLARIEGAADIPLELSADTLIEVPAGRNDAIQIRFESKELAAGNYANSLTISPLDGSQPETTVTVNAKVHNFALPETMPITVFTFDYGAAADPKALDFLLAARNNLFHIPLSRNFQGLDQMLDNLLARRKAGEFQLLIEVWFVRESRGWKPEFNGFLDELKQKLSARGIGPNNWYFHIYDETLSDEFLDSCKAIKAHDPEIRISTDLIVRDPAVIEKFEPYVDCWCPLTGMIPPSGDGSFEKSLAVMRKSGKPIWLYTCSPAPSESPRVYYLQNYAVYLNDFQGSTSWTSRPAEWRNKTNEPNYGLTYRNADGSMRTSLRFLQWQAGLEDYLLLKYASERNKPAADQFARKIFENGGNPALGSIVAKGRCELLELLSKQ